LNSGVKSLGEEWSEFGTYTLLSLFPAIQWC
jgi:hypothetical protein